METNIITKREYLDILVKFLAGDSANPHGDSNQRVRRCMEKLNLLLDTLGYEVEQ
jgi:hypothetical protein